MIYVMSDVHGMYEKYMAMLKLIDLKEQDTLYVLGDMIDRGKEGIRILKDMMCRENVHALFGNHELMCVECLSWLLEEITEKNIEELDLEKMEKLSVWVNNGAYPTIQELRSLTREERQEVLNYIMELSAYEQVSVNGREFLLVHAGLGNFHEGKPLEEYSVEELVWERPNWEIPYVQSDDQFVVVGHTPTLMISGETKIFHKNGFIAIDCGACFPKGKLACLCLDTMEEFYV